MEDQTYEEMLAKAKEVFGDDVEVEFSDNHWVIYTGVEEKFDIEKFKGTVAYAAYKEYEGNYGSTLERWAAKNFHYSSSLHEVCVAYNAENERRWKEAVVEVRRWAAEGKEFDWPGGPEYRDQVLKMAEENGW